MKTTPTAIIYTRVSGPYDTRQASVETQHEECERLAKREGYRVIAAFEERFTGKYLHERKELARAREMIRNKEADALVVYDTDRLSRGGISHLYIIVDDILDSGAQFLCVLEPFENTKEGKVMLALRGYRSEVEREKIRDRTMRGRADKIAKGKLPGQGPEQYGYRKNKETWLKEIYEPEAVIVRRIFQLVADGWGTRGVAKLFNDEGLMTPSASLGRKRVGKKWYFGWIWALIRDPSYKGVEILHGLSRDDKTGKITKRPEEERIYLTSTTPAIVSPDLWERANQAINKNVGDRKRNEKKFVMLRGMVWCRDCGKKCHPVNAKDNVMIFRCGSKADMYDDKCKARSVSVRWLDEQVWTSVLRWLRNPDEIERAKQHEESVIVESKSLETDLARLNKRLKEIDAARERLVKRLTVAEPEDEHLFNSELERLRAERKQIVAAVEDINVRIAKLKEARPTFPTVPEVQELIKYADQFTPEQQREILLKLKIKVKINGRDWVWLPPSGLVEVPPLTTGSFRSLTSFLKGNRSRPANK
jgi:site-specific DNA recombinase